MDQKIRWKLDICSGMLFSWCRSVELFSQPVDFNWSSYRMNTRRVVCATSNHTKNRTKPKSRRNTIMPALMLTACWNGTASKWANHSHNLPFMQLVQGYIHKNTKFVIVNSGGSIQLIVKTGKSVQ